MLVPRYWASADGAATDPKGKRYRLALWGWSQQSAADALGSARRRLDELVKRIARGEIGGARYLYGTQPLREEIIRALGEPSGRSEAVVTRNRYGALVLNTARVPFVDIDSPPVAALTRLAALFRRDPGFDPTFERIREACRLHDRHGFRIYRTRAGYRVLATNLFLDPTSPSAQEFLGGFAADPYFIKLCRLQASFRARLTPKPWRCGCPLPPGQHPRHGDLEGRFARWLTAYEAASDRFASCRYLESVGSTLSSSDSRAIVEEHDRVSRALSDLPLA